MAKRSKRARGVEAPVNRRGSPRPRDALTTLARFSQFLSLGLIGAAVLVPFTPDLDVAMSRMVGPDGRLLHLPPVTLERFPDVMGKIAFLLVHTRLVWITLGIMGMLSALQWYRTRYEPKRNWLVKWMPVAALAVIGIHAAGKGYFAAKEGLIIESHDGIAMPVKYKVNLPVPTVWHDPGPATTASSGAASAPASVSAPATATMPADAATQPEIATTEPSLRMGPGGSSLDGTRLRLLTIDHFWQPEGGWENWTFVFAGDLFYCMAILFVFVFSFAGQYADRLGAGRNRTD